MAGPRTSDTSGPTLAGRYHLLRRIGSGGMADVWEADDLSLGRRVAVKMLHRHLAAEPSTLARFRSEAQSAARLTHPGIVAVYDTINNDEIDAMVMELVDGRDLRTILDERPTLAIDDATEVAHQLALALSHAHQQGIVHRDVKPANILIRPDRRVKLSDFGIAKALDSSQLTDSGTLIGTVRYLAPEQIDGHPVDGRTDLYALTTVFYEMLCGRTPFLSADLGGAMERVRADAPRARNFRPDIPRALDDFLATGLNRNPDHRIADATTWAASLDALRRGDTTTLLAPPPAASVPGERPVARPQPAPSSGSEVQHPPGPGPRREPRPSIPMRAPEPEGPAVVVDNRRGIGSWLGPLVATVLMIAAVFMIWQLLQPATNVVTDQLSENTTTTTTVATTSSTTTTTADTTTTTSTDETDNTVVSTTAVDNTGVDDTDGSSGTDDADAETTTTTIVEVPDFTFGLRLYAFDPAGDGDEHSEAASRAVDADLATFWYTESYNTRRLGGIKAGVGLIIEFESPTELNALRTRTNTAGWAMDVYAAPSPGETLADWGNPIGSVTDGATDQTVDVADTTATAVLLWFTDLGVLDGIEATDENRVRLELYDVDLTA